MRPTEASSEDRAHSNTADTAALVNDAPSQLARSLGAAFRSRDEELFLVGGAVRDHLLGQPDFDLDFATSALPDITVRILEHQHLGKVYRVGERFGTIGLRLDDRLVEITTYRSQEIYAPESRKPEVRFGTTLLEDLRRRDFTINAMARDPITGALIDPLQGAVDLQAGLIRAVGTAADRFGEDPLRILRAVRFASRLGFSIEPSAWEAMVEMAPRLATISRERVRDEFTKMLEDAHPAVALSLMRDAGLLRWTAPLLEELTRMPDHGPRHHLSLWDHTMRVVSAVSPLLSLRWAAVLHDIAKPATRTEEPSGRPRFFHHEEVGARMAREVLTDLRYSNQIVESVVLLIQTHMQLHAYSAEWSDGAVRRLMMRLGPLTQEAIALDRADAAGHTIGVPSANAPKFDHLQERIRHLDEEDVSQLKSPLTGHDLMERYQRPAGPWIGVIKDALLEEVIEGRLAPQEQDKAWRIADTLVNRGDSDC